MQGLGGDGDVMVRFALSLPVAYSISVSFTDCFIRGVDMEQMPF